MIISVLALMLVEGKVDEGLRAVHEALEQTRAFDGSLGAEVAQDVTEPRRLVVIEKWRSLDDDKKYRAWATRKDAVSPLAGLLSAAPCLVVGTHLVDV